MSAVVVDILLGVAVIAAWVGTLGFARLSAPLDRLHCIAFVAVGCGLPITLAAFVQDGASVHAFKLLLMLVVAIVAGASVNQALARTIVTRDEAGERT